MDVMGSFMLHHQYPMIQWVYNFLFSIIFCTHSIPKYKNLCVFSKIYLIKIEDVYIYFEKHAKNHIFSNGWSNIYGIIWNIKKMLYDSIFSWQICKKKSFAYIKLKIKRCILSFNFVIYWKPNILKQAFICIESLNFKLYIT